MAYYEIDFKRKLGNGKWNKNTKFPFIKEKTIDVWIPKLEGEEFDDEKVLEKYTLTTSFEKGWTNVELFNQIYDIFKNKSKNGVFKLHRKNCLIANPKYNRNKACFDSENQGVSQYIFVDIEYYCDFENLFVKGVKKYMELIQTGEEFKDYKYLNKGYKVEVNTKNWKMKDIVIKD